MSVAAILTADLHLSARPPLARSVEGVDWLATQAGYLRQLGKLANRHKASVIVAGDIFDKWAGPTEAINLALDHLPFCYAVPGQHDLAAHNMEDLKKTAFYTLVASGKIRLIEPGNPVETFCNTPLRLHGFPWGYPPEPLEKPHDLLIEVAVVHRYFWTANTGHAEAGEDSRLGKWRDKLSGYDVILSGDNHVPFHCKLGNAIVWNAGSFMRRKADEIDHKPSVGLLHSDKEKGLWVERHYLDVSKDRFADAPILGKLAGAGIDADAFLAELAELGDKAEDFAESVRLFFDRHKVPAGVRHAVLEAMGE